MKKFSKIIGLMLIVSILVGASITWERDEVSEGEVIEVEFPYEIEDVEVPDGFEYLGYENGVHRFKALKDMENVSGELFYEEQEKENEVEGGATNDNGEVGTGESGVADWDSYELGKNRWRSGEEYIYSIRLRADKFNKEDTIKIIDIPNQKMNYTTEVYVVGYHIESEEIGSPDVITANTKYNDLGFEVEFEPTDHDIYEVNYVIDVVDGLTNGYRAMQKGVEIISGGEIVGDIKPEEVEPPATEEPEEEPEDIEPPTEDKEEPIPTPEEKPIPEPEESPKPEPEEPSEPKPEPIPERPKPEEPEQGPELEPEPEKPVEEKPAEPIIPEEPSKEVPVRPDKPSIPVEPTIPEDKPSEPIEEPDEPEQEPEEPIEEPEEDETEEPEEESEEPNDSEDEPEESEKDKDKPSETDNPEKEVERLPATGSKDNLIYYIIGAGLILVGTRKLKHTK